MEITAKKLQEYLSYNHKTGRIFWKKKPASHILIGAETALNKNHRYARVMFKRKNLSAHRVAWAIYYGEMPNDQIDHINGNTFDNRIKNLRCVSSFENMRNQRKHRTGKLWGAHYLRGKWQASFRYKKKGYYLGLFESAELANKKCVEFVKANSWEKELFLGE